MAKGKKNNNGGRGSGAQGPPMSADVYSGPLNIPRGPSGQDSILRLCTAAANLSSTAGGEITTVYSSDPTSTTVWSNFAGTYDRYRVLGLRVEYQPHSRYNPYVTATATSVIRQGISTVFDPDDSTALTSHAGAAVYATHKFHNLSDPWSVEGKASGKLLMQYNTTAAVPPVIFAIKLYAGTGLTASTTYGIVILKYLVQFASSN